jgi:hypothetical protein
MLPIAHCPRCDERVQVPNVFGSVDVRCPWCAESFSIEEVLQSLPPALEIVGIAGMAQAGVEVEDDDQVYEVSNVAFDAGNLAGSDEIVFKLDDDFATGADSVGVPRGSRASHGSRSHGRSRGRRKRESPFVGFLKMAGGGVAGIAIALAILQTMDRLPDLGFWPFRGPGTKVFSSDMFGFLGKAESSTNSEQEDANRGGEDKPARKPKAEPKNKPIELPLPEFAKMSMEDNSTTEPTDGGIAHDELEESNIAIDSQSNQRAQVAINDVIDRLNDTLFRFVKRDEGMTVDAAAESIRMELAVLAMPTGNDSTLSAASQKQLDTFVEELIFQKELLKSLLQKSSESIENLGAPEGSNFHALVGQVILDDGQLALAVPTASRSLPLYDTLDKADITEGAVLLLIGSTVAEEIDNGMRVVYAKSLKK